MKHILDRSESEVTKQIYLCQKSKPSPGDWCNLIDRDFEEIKLCLSQADIEGMCLNDYKSLVKQTVRKAAFQSLEEKKNSHSKVSQNQYTDMDKPQGYIVEKNTTNTHVSILFALRSRSIRGIKTNFQHLYSHNTLCPICERSIDTQEHLIQCKVLLDILPLTENISYSDLQGSTQRQVEFVRIYEQYLTLRDEILEDTASEVCLPVLHTGPKRHQARVSARSCTRVSVTTDVSLDGIK